jgi:hypothetical protein
MTLAGEALADPGARSESRQEGAGRSTPRPAAGHGRGARVGRSGGLVALLPRGEAIRNFAHTGALDIVQSSVDVTVLSVVPDPAAFEALSARYHRVLPLEEPAERYPVRILRDLLDMAHGRRLWSAAAQERWRLRDVEADTLAKRAKRWGRKALCLPFASQPGLRLLEGAERLVSRALRTTDDYVSLYRELRPSLVFNGSHIHCRNAIHAVHAARWLKIPTAAFVFSWDNLTSQGRVVPAYDYYMVWNDQIKQQLLEIYPHVRAEQVVVTGTPQFDSHFRPETYWTREEFCRRNEVDPSRPIVFYTTGMAEHMQGEPLIVEQLADMLADMEDLGRPQLLLRVYPKDRTGRFEELRARRPDIRFQPARWIETWLTPTEADTQLLTNSVRHVDVGVNVASTVSLELCMFDRPVVNVGYDPPGVSPRVPYARYYEYDHYRPLVERGAVTLARSVDEMRTMLRSALADPSRGRADRCAFTQHMFGDTLDGRSGERVAATLLRLAGTRRRGD